jgi:xanthine dehydrogenase accessory factor
MIGRRAQMGFFRQRGAQNVVLGPKTHGAGIASSRSSRPNAATQGAVISSEGAGEALVFILGANEIASAVAVHIHRTGFVCVMGEDPYPPVIRRLMAFHDVLFGEPVVLDGVSGLRAETTFELLDALANGSRVVVTPLHVSDLIALRMPNILIDARMHKYRVTPDLRGVARLAIGLGPNFCAGGNCDVAIETRPVQAGRIVEFGAIDSADHRPSPLGGVGAQRLVYSDREGLWHTALEIGVRAFKGMMIGRLAGLPVLAPIDGPIRGVARDGSLVPRGVKILEIDPRGRHASWTGIEPRAAKIAGAVARAVRVRRAERASAVSSPRIWH